MERGMTGYWVSIVISMVFGGGCGGLVTYFFKKSIASKFYKENTEFKSKMAQQHTEFKSTIEHELDTLLDRKIKWHDKEHEVLAETWSKLIDSYNKVNSLMITVLSFSDFNNPLEDDVDKILKRFLLTEDEKQRIREQPKENRNNTFFTIIDEKLLSPAFEAAKEFKTYFDRNKIFIKPPIKEKFQNANDLIWSAWYSQQRHLNSPFRTISDYEPYRVLNDKMKPLIDELEKIIQNQLYP